MPTPIHYRDALLGTKRVRKINLSKTITKCNLPAALVVRIIQKNASSNTLLKYDLPAAMVVIL